ncbi:phospholipase A2 receptor 1 [Parelaphostrongylus tenuis]|uniref:Phospholipase A2 receptor 1 n=1 Tax=Parelaphostrongylus tenuis TaxID=148309 RepID=A0AAD5RB93_PARTN|nr:phospholipase A2 receptor 1 [Parelaphostrongylus tenuis]
MVLPQRLRWFEAEQECAKAGGRLASITDEYENAFAFNLSKRMNLTTPTVWLGRLVRLSRTGAYEWHDGAIGRQTDAFREPPSGTDLCMTMWLDFDRPEGSWYEWDCGYASGYSALCKKRLNKPAFPIVTSPPTEGAGTYLSQRCCINGGCSQRCSSTERCIPDDLNCWWRTCASNGMGWCLPVT